MPYAIRRLRRGLRDHIRGSAPLSEGRFVAYYRVSTAEQGRSGLGLEAQRAAVEAYLNGGSWELAAEFTEVESGKRADRPELAKALDRCRLIGTTLVIAKFDRLTRNVAFMANLMESGAEFPDAAWNVSQMALRIPGPLGDPPICIITSTPRAFPAFKRIRSLPTTVITISPTMDNAQNLSPEALGSLVDQYGGTRLGRQELGAEMIDDVDGALWRRQLIEECRIRRGTEPARMRRVIVAVDPPGASGKSSAECGIIIAGTGPDRNGYVMADLSGHYTPEQWARKAIEAYHGYKADRIVAERNFGGEMVEWTLRSIDRSAPLKMVVASRGKQIRAEPVASWYEQHKVHHIGEFPDLEDQMCSWDPAASDPSPDRVDAVVWALSELTSGPPPMRVSKEALERSRQLGSFHHAF